MPLLSVNAFSLYKTTETKTIVYTQAYFEFKCKMSCGQMLKIIIGKFFKTSPKQKITGVLYYSNKIDWCNTKLNISLYTDIPKKSWIALIPRGNDKDKGSCGLSRKVRAAKNIDANAVMFYNNETRNSPVMKGETHGVVTFMTGLSDGERLAEMILDKEQYGKLISVSLNS